MSVLDLKSLVKGAHTREVQFAMVAYECCELHHKPITVGERYALYMVGQRAEASPFRICLACDEVWQRRLKFGSS